MGKLLYDDGRYQVSSAVVSTPHRFYPLANTSASIRRDPLWAGFAVSAFVGAGMLVYGDLLHTGEQVALLCFCAVSLGAGQAFSILRISATGHAGAMIVGRSNRIRKLYLAIRDSRSVQPLQPFHISEDE